MGIAETIGLFENGVQRLYLRDQSLTKGIAELTMKVEALKENLRELPRI
jgi:hypothetical protein